MDSGPERTWAEEFRKKYPKLFICLYHLDSSKGQIIEWGGDTNSESSDRKLGYVWIDRNRVIDGTVYDMMRGDIEYNLNRDELELLMSHWGTMSRIEETKLDGTKKYSWVTSTGVNHMSSAMWFYWIARKRAMKPVEVLDSIPDRREVIYQDGEGFKMRSLKEIIEERNA
jgi:hypothetical protein